MCLNAVKQNRYSLNYVQDKYRCVCEKAINLVELKKTALFIPKGTSVGDFYLEEEVYITDLKLTGFFRIYGSRFQTQFHDETPMMITIPKETVVKINNKLVKLLDDTKVRATGLHYELPIGSAIYIASIDEVVNIQRSMQIIFI